MTLEVALVWRDVGGLAVLLTMAYFALLNLIYYGSERGSSVEYWEHPHGIDWLFYPVKNRVIEAATSIDRRIGFARTLSAVALAAVTMASALVVWALLGE